MERSTTPWARGAAAGALAAAPMSAVMLAAKALGQTGTLPPTRITTAALRTAGLTPGKVGRAAATIAGHFGYAATCGAAFAWLHREPTTRGRAALHGVAFGSLVWGVSYAGWVPALGLLPWPEEDRPHRPSVMLLAHWVFGAVLGLAHARRRRPAAPPVVPPTAIPG